jgi:hypothetical protein
LKNLIFLKKKEKGANGNSSKEAPASNEGKAPMMMTPPKEIASQR